MNLDAEWLEPDGRGGFASGTVGGVRTRRYHALLLSATHPPVGRMVLINGLEVFLETAGGRFPLSTQCYPGNGGDGNGVLAPRGRDHLIDFQIEPWPRWTFQFPDGTRVEHEIFVHQSTGLTALGWKLVAQPDGAGGTARLEVRPLFSGRDYHATHHENPAFAFTPVSQENGNAAWQVYPGLPLTRVWSNGNYRHDPKWYQHFLYAAERARGLDCVEDLALPGVFTFELTMAGQEASMLLGAVMDPAPGIPPGMPPAANAGRLLPALRTDELKRRGCFADPLARSTDAYVVRGARGPTIIAGYPWFTDWGRDTFISMRGLCLATGRFEEAREILLGWTGSVSEGMLPNRFPDGGEAAVYNSVDASLWFVIAAHDYLALAPSPMNEAAMERWARDRHQLLGTCEAILDGYANGTRYGIRADPSDGLLLAGEPGVALTWMDVVIDGEAVTPRTGKAVEIQALWLNALHLMAAHSTNWQLLYEMAQGHFAAKFWNGERGCLYDVIDCEGRPGVNDGRVRPNQLFAVGGLPLVLLGETQGRAMLETVERELLTPVGLRTLARGEPGYCPEYAGGPAQRDRAYHQGTVWPWLLGAFVEAWVRVHGDTVAVRAQARARFVDPLLAGLPGNLGTNHLAELADAEPPHAPKGCPYQAWSMGELIRLSRQVLR